MTASRQWARSRDRSWSDLMRIFITLIIVVIATIIALVWFIIYRIRHHKAPQVA